ncbi:MAG: heparinase II/III family protein [Anaerolineae bacterium]|nr:heparinase II/III family protein [Anaerolineae bacterium]
MDQQPTKNQLKMWLQSPQPLSDLRAQIVASPTTPRLLDAIRREVPVVTTIPQTTYTLYREFEHTGQRGGYESLYFMKRAQLSRAVLEYIMGNASMLDAVHDLLWSICEETSWVLPAHEEQGPNYWDVYDRARLRTEPLGAHTSLTREPDTIDLFAAETGAALAEVVYLIGDDLAPEVRQRVRQEVTRHIFKPYLAYGREHWWFTGKLNWNGVCNGSIGLAFLRLEHDLETLAEALTMVLAGFATYIATGFEADGGSIEGVGYWNYGLLYYVTVAELLREITGGELDLLAQPRLVDIAKYPPGMALAAPNRFINFGDAKEEQAVRPCLGTRLAERTGVEQLRALIAPLTADYTFGINPIGKLPIVMRDAAWWDATQPAPALEQGDFCLPDVGVVKLVGQTETGQRVILATKSGHTDGHHSHADIATFIVNIGGESLIPDPGRGLYSKSYFRKERYDNIFNNSYAHSVPRIGTQLQSPGPEFGGSRRFFGKIVEFGQRNDVKYNVIDFNTAYDISALMFLRRTLELNTKTGVIMLTDEFGFEGDPLTVEEAFSTWFPVEVDGPAARIIGEHTTLVLTIIDPAEGLVFAAEPLTDDCRANQMDDILTRLTVVVPPGAKRFKLQMMPLFT